MKPKPKPTHPSQGAQGAIVPFEDLMDRINVVEIQIQAEKLTRQQLTRLYATGIVFAEDLAAALETERNLRKREPGTVAIIEALAASAKEGWDMRQTVDTALHTLAPKHDSLLALKTVLQYASQDSRSDTARKGAAVRHSKDPRQIAKAFIQICWSNWRSGKSDYDNKAKFARDMLDKFPDVLKNERKITDWVREWDIARDKQSASKMP